MKQNVVTVASSTLEDSISEINDKNTNFTSTTTSIANNNSIKNKKRRSRNRSLTSSFGKGFSEKAELNTNQRPSSAGLRLDTNESLILSNNTNTNKAQNKNRLLKDLQYGDILFRCTSFN